MHERSLIGNLIRKIATLPEVQGGARVVGLTVRLGALSQISAAHFREHFDHETAGTAAEGARLTIIESTEIGSEDAQAVVLESVELSS